VTLGRQAYSIIDLLILGALLFSIITMAGVLTNLLRSRVLQRAGINRGLQEVIAMLTKYSVVTIATIILLQIWGLDLSSLAILASALGVGIGFGLQDIAKNFGSGLVLVFERPIQVGDFVEVGEFKGTVEQIAARSTEIRTLDHVSIIVPNSRFLEKEVINWSHRNPVSRLHIPVGVAYQADPQTVQTALLEAAQNHPDVLPSPPPTVLFQGFGDSALNFELLVWTSTPNRQFLLRSDLNFLIFETLKRWHIEIPFPQRDLHLRSLQVAPELRETLSQISFQSSNGSSTS
jgi:potassium-dependent mechanosensitive channel